MTLYDSFVSYIGELSPTFSEAGRPWYDPAYIAVCVLAVVFILMVFRFFFGLFHKGGHVKYG